MTSFRGKIWIYNPNQWRRREIEKKEILQFLSGSSAFLLSFSASQEILHDLKILIFCFHLGKKNVMGSNSRDSGSCLRSPMQVVPVSGLGPGARHTEGKARVLSAGGRLPVHLDCCEPHLRALLRGTAPSTGLQSLLQVPKLKKIAPPPRPQPEPNIRGKNSEAFSTKH